MISFAFGVVVAVVCLSVAAVIAAIAYRAVEALLLGDEE